MIVPGDSGQKDKYWSLTAYIVGDIQRSVPDENLLTRHRRNLKRSRQKKVYLMLIHMMVVVISITAVISEATIGIHFCQGDGTVYALQHGSLQVL